MSIHFGTQNPSNIFSAGDWLFWGCKFEKAREHFQAILTNQSSLTQSDFARCYQSLGAVEVSLKNYDEAINFYNKQLNVLHGMCNSESQNEDIASCYVSIGKVYWLKSDYRQAITYHYRALERKPSENRLSAIYKNLANMFTITKQFELTLDFFEKTLRIDEKQQSKNNLKLGQTYADIATMYQLKQDDKEALNYFQKARETLLETLPTTHRTIKKMDKTIYKVKNNITSPPVVQVTIFNTSIYDLIE